MKSEWGARDYEKGHGRLYGCDIALKAKWEIGQVTRQDHEVIHCTCS